MKQRFTLLLTLFSFAALPLLGAELTSTEELVGYDRRREQKVLPDAAQLGAQKAAGRSVRGMKVDFDPLLGSPKWVHSTEDFLTGPAGTGKSVSADTAARYRGDEHLALNSFLDEHRALFRHGPEVLDESIALRTRDSVAEGSGARTTVWRQRLDGIMVYEAVLASHLTSRGELINLSSLFVPDVRRAAKRGTPNHPALLRAPQISARRAIEIAAPIINERADDIASDGEMPAGPEQRQLFKVKPLPGDVSAQLIWFPLDHETLRLCWQVEMTRRKLGERFRFLVDLQNGEVLLWRKLTVEIQPVSYRVFTNDSPRPLRPGWPTPNPALPPLVSNSLVTISALSSNASPLGWINDGEALLRGNNVEGRLDRDGDDRADLPRITASVDGVGNRSFDFPISPDLHPTNYSKGAAVQLFYWCNYAHDRLYDIGFTEARGNFQKDNFGRGGNGNDAMIADAQDGSGVNNANYTPAADGTPGRIQMFIFTGPTPPHDGDLDVEVVLHEYVHGMSDRRVGHGIGISQLQTYGLGEGWSDFFAEAMLTRFEHNLDASYPMGGYASYRLNGLQESYYFGIRRYPYSTSTNVSPLMFQDIDPQQVSPYPGVPRSPIANSGAAEVHRQGEVWCLMLWELRAALLRRMNVTAETYDAANDFIMRLVGDAMDYGPPNPTFVQARDAILSADRILTAPTGQVGTNYYTIWQAFAKRGLGVGASSPDVTTTSGVIASTAVPQQPPLIVSPDAIAFLGGIGGPFSPTGAVFTVRNPTSVPVSWSVYGIPSWLELSLTNGTLLPEQQVVVSLATNGFYTLPVASHNATLVFTNNGTNFSLSRLVTVTVLPVADPLMVDPTSAFSSAGPPGGPFAPQSRLYTLEASAPLAWHATNVPAWISLSRTNGTLADGEFVEVTATVNSLADDLPPGIYPGKFYFVNSGSGAQNEMAVSLRVGGESYVVEHFATNQVDLDFSTLTLTPSGDSYSACIEPASAFFVETVEATQLFGMGDDEYRFVSLQEGKTIAFFGVPTNAFWIGANGNITPDPGINTNAYFPGLFEFFAHSRIAPLFADLNPAAGGKVFWQQLSNRVVVTWENVPQFDFAQTNRASTNNVQLEVFFSGIIRMTWLGLDVLTADFNPPSATVGISRGTGVPAEFLPNDLSTENNCSPSGRLVVPTRVREGDTNVQGAILLTGPPGTNIYVMLTCDNTNELVVPSTFVIPAGQHFFYFPILVKDDVLLDGTHFAGLTAVFSDRPADSARIAVEDNESTRIILALPAEAREGDGVISGEAFVLLGADAGRDIFVSLASSNTTRVTVPASVVVPAGSRVGYFDLDIRDDEFLNGTEEVRVVASVDGWQFDHDVIQINDNESYALAISLAPEVAENGGSLAEGGIVSLSAIPVAPVTVSFISDRPNAVFTQGSIEIPAGSLSNTFPLFVVDNGTTNAFDSVRIVALSPGFLSATGSVTVIDDERPTPPFNPFPSNGAVRVSSTPILSWQISPVPPPGTMRYDVFLSTNSEPSAGDYIGSTFNEAGTNRVDFLLPGLLESAVTYYWRVTASRAPFSATTPVWTFTTSPFHHFAVDPVLSPQVAGQPFDVSVSARDEFDSPVINFSGTAYLSNSVPRRTSSTIVLTEIDTEADRLEFQNVSDRSIDIAGWQVIVYDWFSWPLPQALLTLPGPALCKTGDTFQVRNLLPRFAPGVYPNFVFPTNVLWNNNATSNQVAVLVRDTLGNIVEFVAAFDADPSQIVVPLPIPASQWQGSPVPANLDTRLSLQLTGNRDLNSSEGWIARSKNFLTNNPGLIVPFTNYVSLPMVATPVTNFVGGAGVSVVTIFDEAQGMVLTAHGTNSATGPSASVDVFATNDISVAISAPEVVVVYEDLLARVVVTNRGASASGVFVTNRLGDGSVFISATSSQGACSGTNGVIVCDLGALPGNGFAIIDMLSRPVVPGLVTNVAVIARLDGDSYAGNNTAEVVTLARLPQVSINDTNVGEPFASTASLLTFTVRLSVRSSATTYVAFATSDGTASGGTDYVSTNGIVVFPPGVTNQPLSVSILDDLLHESNETFSVILTGVTNALITRGTGGATIFDNDPSPVMQVLDVTVSEPGSGTNAAAFKVTVTPPSARVVSVSYITADGTAIAGLDYETVYGTLVFQPGVTNLTVSSAVFGDRVYDPGKNFRFVLSNPNGVQVIRAIATCSILDNDSSELHHLAFETVPADASVNVPFAFAGSARDAAGAVFTNFTGPVHFLATDNEADRTVGTNNVPWNYPLGAGFHDSRLQTIYLASELGAAGQVTAISLDVTNVPGQVLSNFTIRTQPYPLVQFPIGAWIDRGWTTNFHADVSIISTGWTTFAFRTPYTFNGLTNILVDFSFNNASYSSDGFCSSTFVPAARSLVFRTDSAYGNPLGWTNMNPLVVITNRIANARFTIGDPVPVLPSMTSNVLNGLWGAALTFGAGASNLTLRAVDNDGHLGIYSGFQVLTDRDGDGMPDDWELANGFDPANATDALLDADGDGLTNLQEFTAGTDPRNPGSIVKIIGAFRETNVMHVTIQSVLGKKYSLETSNTLPPVWIPVHTNPSDGTGGPLVISHRDVLEPARFYRVRVLQ